MKERRMGRREGGIKERRGGREGRRGRRREGERNKGRKEGNLLNHWEGVAGS